MGAHLIDGKFQSDKYPTCPRGKVPLSVEDETAWDLLWEYAQRRRMVDAEFADDLEIALVRAGYTEVRRRALEGMKGRRVEDAARIRALEVEVLAPILEERERLYESLTRVQARCTELSEENRKLRGSAALSGHTCCVLGPCDGSCPSGGK